MKLRFSVSKCSHCATSFLSGTFSQNGWFFMIVFLGMSLVLSPTFAQPTVELDTSVRPVGSGRLKGAAFGRSVATKDNTVIIGQPGTYDGSQEVVYVYDTNNGQWSLTQVLSVDGNVSGIGGRSDDFGWSLALSGDIIVVGAPGITFSSNGQGAAYVYMRNNNSWTQTAKLIPSDAAPGDGFGLSVATDGTKIVIGARNAAYLYTRNGNAWTQTAKLNANDQPDRFGTSVAINNQTIAVGATGIDALIYEGSSGAQGAVYLFNANGSSWMQTAKLTATDGAEEDGFGCSLAMQSDRLVIGAAGANVNGKAYQGAAYVYALMGSDWTQAAKLTADDGKDEDRFGNAVTIDNHTIIVGAFLADLTQENAGAAYVYSQEGSSWTQTAKLTSINVGSGVTFGNSVAVLNNRVVVGESGFGSSPGNAQNGRAYIFDLLLVKLTVALDVAKTKPDTAAFNLKWNYVGDETGFVLETILGSQAGAWQTMDTLAANTNALMLKIKRGQADSLRSFRLRALRDGQVIASSSVVTAYVQAAGQLNLPTLRINCGGPAVTTVNGKIARNYIADRYFTSGSQPRAINVGDIANTTNDILYLTFRSGENFSYNIPIKNGQYQVYLNFAELFFTAPGQRVFSVNLEGGETELENLDVFAIAGGSNRALSRNFPVTVNDGVLTIDFISSISRAMISIIQIVPAGSSAREGVKELAMDEISFILYPNPSDGSVMVQFAPNGNTASVVEIYDLKGNLVEWQVDSEQTGQLAINQQHQLAPGIYVVRVQSGDKVQHQKLVVIH